MRRYNTSFEDLVSENIKEILSDPEALARIEKRMDERTIKRNKEEAK